MKDICVYGLGTMGANLARNFASRGLEVLVYGRNQEKTQAFLEKHSENLSSVSTLKEVLAALKRPRKILLMIKSGAPVDDVLTQFLDILEPGDILMDGGNSHYLDTDRRVRAAKQKGVEFLGVGVSGGEEGALQGPSLMVGGPESAWNEVRPLLESVAAEADGKCVAYFGDGGAGHFVKMVHNGIEYALMQLIAESYDLLKHVNGIQESGIAQVFSDWNNSELESFLLEITARILAKEDDQNDSGKPLVESILDVGSHKGTGKWTVQAALDLGVAVPSIAAALDARMLSYLKTIRATSAKAFVEPEATSKPVELEDLKLSLYAASILSYLQGLVLIESASLEYKWNLKLDEVLRVWKSGCIIRAKLLDELRGELSKVESCMELLKGAAFMPVLGAFLKRGPGVLKAGSLMNVGLPSLSASLTYLQTLVSSRLPQNLVQAQRDYFGAHTYKRVDLEGVFHTDWD